MNIRWKEAAVGAGIPFGRRTMTYNSRLAQELSKWANSKGNGDEFHKEVFNAYFVDGKNICSPSLLADLAEKAGLSREEAEEIMETRAFEKKVDADWSRALEVDPEYVPSLMLNGKLLVNPQKYELFDQFMKDHNVRKR